MKDFQIHGKEIQAGWKQFQIRRKEIQIQIPEFPSPNPALSRAYADPHGFPSFLSRVRPFGAAASSSLLVRLRLSAVSFNLRFGPSLSSRK
jgi:hypothetical protein